MTDAGPIQLALKRRNSFVVAVARALFAHDAAGAASAMAFHAFFSMVPLIALIGWTSHRIVRADANVLESLLRFTPRVVSALADSQLFRLSPGGDAVLAPLSAIGFLWLASGGVAVAMKELEAMFGAPRRGWLKRRMVALGYVVGALAVVALCVAFALLAARVGSMAGRAVAVALPFMALWFLVASFFRLATARHEGIMRRGFVGALVTLAAWAVVSLSFSLYVRQIGSYSRFYGSVAAVAVLLVWLWLMAFSLLIGGEVNARLEGTRGTS
jgi:membrane protein